MAKGYCTYSYTYVPMLGSDTYYCLSKGHPQYKEKLDNYDNSRLVSNAYYREWCDTKQCEECHNFYQKSNSAKSSFSAADEIRKYKDLFDEGVITKEIFEEKKKELLNI